MTRPKTKILVDGGDPQEARRVKECLGFVDGQTTTPPDALSFPAVPPGPAVTGQRSQIGSIAILVSRGHRKMADAKPFWSTLYHSLTLLDAVDYEYRRSSIDKNIDTMY